jgi:LPS sulfotransferase NodH
MDNYIICATPRSGSNLFCELLSSLGFAGKPEEHLWNPPNERTAPLTDSAPRDTVAALLIFLGYNDPVTVSLDLAQHRRQADDVTETWIHRYEQEQKGVHPR